jgi:AAA family ATP:ADP antiporter
LKRAANAPEAGRRELAAVAIAIRGDAGAETLHDLLEDSDPKVVAAACRAAGELKNRAYLFQLIRALGDSNVRGEAVAALAAYGPGICGTLADALLDDSMPLRIRRQIPRVLKRIPNQRAVDALLGALGHQDLSTRAAVLKGLNRLRETAPQLNFDAAFLTDQILAEARRYFELNAALQPFWNLPEDGRAARLLARSIEERLRNTLERLFRLLGLRYPPKEIYSAYLAVSKPQGSQASAAMEFLESVLSRDLKRILIPLLDAPEHALARGAELFGIRERSPEEAVRELIRSRDPWLVACAMAAAAELRMRSLAPDIAEAAQGSEQQVTEVARSAEALLAA